MAQQAASRLWSLEAFLDFEDGSDRRHELIEGTILAMAPPSRAHGTLTSRLAHVFGNALQPPCEAIVEAGILSPAHADTFYQADVVVTCKPGQPGDRWIEEPRVIVEVLSPSTAALDFDLKLPDYRRIPSVEHVVAVSSTARRIQHWRREEASWRFHDLRGEDTLEIAGLGISLGVAGLYDGVLERPG